MICSPSLWLEIVWDTWICLLLLVADVCATNIVARFVPWISRFAFWKNGLQPKTLLISKKVRTLCSAPILLEHKLSPLLLSVIHELKHIFLLEITVNCHLITRYSILSHFSTFKPVTVILLAPSVLFLTLQECLQVMMMYGDQCLCITWSESNTHLVMCNLWIHLLTSV